MESLPLTGPMYIISEARIKIDRVRKRKDRKEWREGTDRQQIKTKRTDLGF